MSVNPISQYIAEIDKIYRTGNATEHSYRPALKTLFENLTKGLTITNEPKHIDCGAPDYIITRNSIPLGYIEAKDISVGLDNKSNKEQFDRYRQSLNNLIITDYLTFRYYTDGHLILSVSIAHENKGIISPDKDQYDLFVDLISQFTKYPGKTISTSESLAVIMADKSKLLAEVIYKAIKDNSDPDNTLIGQYEGLKKVLLHNLDLLDFSDIYAQTLAYGLFAARLNQKDDQRFTRILAAHLIPQSNPFLQKFFYYIAGIDLDTRIVWIVDALADVFNSVAVEDIKKEFQKSNQDPYIHFYETFLAKYDPKLRETRGVYYTPLPVVQFIVRAVDDILKSEFDIKNGLADHTKLKNIVIDTDGTKKSIDFHKIQILDPAAGTGTFLAEVIEKIYSNFANNKGAWQGYCTEHLIPRINGFEILMASYAMAHFKLDMKLKETEYTGDGTSRLKVYLTNSLEEPPKDVPELFMEKWLTDEAIEANNVKKNTPVMVVLGNPPYSGESANFTKEEFLAPYKKEPGGKEKLKERNPKWLNDDYVKFIRYGQTFIEKYGIGILAFINNHGFLDNPTFRGMRWNLLKTFEKIYILNLHGNSKKKETCPDGSKDENVFDIQQGVSINLFIKTDRKNGGLAKVFYSDLYGMRKYKYEYLESNDIATIQWDKIKPESNNYFFVNKNFDNILEYKKGFLINDMFPVNGVGITTAHDDFVISDNKDTLLNRFSQFKESPAEKTYLHEKFNVNEKEGWDILKGWNNIQKKQDLSCFVKPISYRPFDNRYIFYEDSLVWRTVTKIMRHLIHNDNVGLTTHKREELDIPFAHIFVVNALVEHGLTSSKTTNYVFPLYLYPEKGDLDETEKRRPNLNNEIIQTLAQKIGLKFVDEKTDNDREFAPIDILDYIYAVLHSPIYRTKYKELLKIDFPRIPYPANAEQFCRLAALGSILRNLHLMENVSPSHDKATFPIAGSNEITTQKYDKGKVFINKTQYFENVPLEAWEFYIGGYQPAKKWLKDRMGRIFIFDEIEHYRKIITVLSLTMDIQQQIDEVVNF
jgi:predicted helicase